MRRPASLIVLAALAVWLPTRTARADQNWFSAPAYMLSVAPIGVLPSEAGLLVAPSGTIFVFGWSWQVPLDGGLHHRIVGGVDLPVRSSGVSSVRGRVGYRYGGRHLFAGAGVGLDGAGVNLSPELGVKFAHVEADDRSGLDTSMHVVVRADVAPATGQVSTTFLLGWNLF